jgi:predicted extracellular nuclease
MQKMVTNTGQIPSQLELLESLLLLTANQARIHDIQGIGLRSTLEGSRVNVDGIVTAIARNGFYLQDPNPDSNSQTSEGIFVFTGSRNISNIQAGDAVNVSGTVTEFQSGGATTNNLTITQINAPSTINDLIEVVSSGNALPAATLIGSGDRIPPTQIIASADFPVISLDSGIGFYESLEGMLVTVINSKAVSPTSNFSSNSEIWVVANQGVDATGINSRGGIGITPDDFNPERIQIDDGLLRLTTGTRAPQVNVGDTLGDVTGVISYAFGNYEVLATQPVNATSGGLQREVTNIVGTADKLTIASYNVENLNPTAGARFDVLAGQIINNLKSPDIIGLQEIQDNTGTIDDGIVAAELSYQGLIDAIAAAGGPTYNFLNIDQLVEDVKITQIKQKKYTVHIENIVR